MIKTWSFLQAHKAFCGVIAVFLLVSFVFIVNFPNQKIWGDEDSYIVEAHKQPLMDGYVPTVLPGFMEYRWWPPFAFSFYALFKTEALSHHYTVKKLSNQAAIEHEKSNFLKRLTVANVLLLLIGGTAFYAIALSAGLGRTWSAFAIGLVLINPRVLFYEQALWPEPLHFALISCAILPFIHALKSKKNYLLALSSVVFAYGSLTKGVVGIYVMCLAGLLIYVYARDVGVAKLVGILLLFLSPYLLLTHAQKLKNYRDHGDYVISPNTWINIEMGLAPYDLPLAAGYKNVYDRYFSTAETFSDREAAAMQRSVDFVLSEPLESVVFNQSRNYAAMLNRSFFKWGLEGNRWDNTSSLGVLEIFSISLSWFLIVLGGIGLVRFMFVSPVITTLSLFLMYYLSAMAVVGFSPRIFVPTIPFLAIFSALTLRSLRNRILYYCNARPTLPA